MSDIIVPHTHEALEQELLVSSREFARRALQVRLDLLAVQEC